MRTRLCSLVAGACLSVLGCSGDEPSPTESVGATTAPVIQLEPPTTVEQGSAAPPREATCPGNRLPDQCGDWAGVELSVANDEHHGHGCSRRHGRGNGHDDGNGHGHDKGSGHARGHGSGDDHGHGQGQDDAGRVERCLCEPIDFEIPSELAVTSGSSGRDQVELTFRTEGGSFVECTYRGNERRRGGNTTGGDKFLFVRCSDGSQPGDHVRADWFRLDVSGGGGDLSIDLRLGEPDVVGGVVQEQIFYSSDPRIPDAALYVPRGTTPAFETFSLEVIDEVPIGTEIENGGAGLTSVSYLVDVHSDSSDDFAFTDVSGAGCPRIELPYDAAAMAALGVPTEQWLVVRQVTTLDGLEAGEEVLARVGPATVNLTRGTLTFCVEHLSFYLGGVSTYNSDLTAATVVTPGGTVNLMTTLPSLVAGSSYPFTLTFRNIGTMTWQAGNSDPRLVEVNPPAGSSPIWTVSQLTGTSAWGFPAPPGTPPFSGLVATNQSATFTFTLGAPSPSAPLNLCLRTGPSSYFGECFSWDLGTPPSPGTTPPTVCVATTGQSCGNCGGQVLCDGSCSVADPGNLGAACGCSGAIQCNGSCSNPGPANLGAACDCGGAIQCNGTCSGTPPATYYFDADGDGYGTSMFPLTSCGAAPSGYVNDSTDCCDGDARAHPGNTNFYADLVNPNACPGMGYDFNCDGVETQWNTFIGAQAGCDNLFCCDHDGWESFVPACGETATLVDCYIPVITVSYRDIPDYPQSCR